MTAVQGKAIGFIGGGAMASAIVKGLIDSGIDPKNLIVHDISKETLDALKQYGVIVGEIQEVVNKSDIIMICVKPDIVFKVLPELADQLNILDRNPLIVSIAAGVSLSQLDRCITEGYIHARRIVRVMPNTPCLVGEAASVFSVNDNVKISDKDIIKDLFSCVGIIFQVEEKYMNAVTGLSGSGPAYAFMMIEAMADGGVRMGLQRDIAQKLAAQTLKGAAEMVLKTKKHPGMLKDMVCSPGGMTIAAVETLESKGFRSAAMGAVITSANNAMEAEAARRS